MPISVGNVDEKKRKIYPAQREVCCVQAQGVCGCVGVGVLVGERMDEGVFDI